MADKEEFEATTHEGGSLLDEGTAAVILSEIKEGKRIWDLNGTKYITRFPTGKDDAAARFEYAKVFNKALEAGIPSQEQMAAKLKAAGIWGDKDNEELSKLREATGALEVILSKKSPKDTSKQTKKLAGELIQKRGELIEKSSELTGLMNQTIEAIAEEARVAFLISACTENGDGTPVWPDHNAFMSDKNGELVNTATYEFTTFSNGLSENYIDMLPEVKFLKDSAKDETDEGAN
jgi:hypothetical protein